MSKAEDEVRLPIMALAAGAAVLLFALLCVCGWMARSKGPVFADCRDAPAETCHYSFKAPAP
jgi:hypothetical protein